MSMQDIEGLKTRTRNVMEGLRIKREGDKLAGERDKMISEAKQFMMLDFWCDKCKRDCVGSAHKVVRLHSIANVNIASYIGKCPVGHKVVRFITDKFWDPYYTHSRTIAIQRRQFAKDLLQPGDEGFKSAYGHKEGLMPQGEEG